jgi:HD-like signal output (HDOD) protein
MTVQSKWLKNEKLLSQLETCECLPQPSERVLALVELLDQESISGEDAALALAEVQDIGDRLLLAANHPIRGSRRQARNLRQALALMGERSVISLAVTILLISELGQFKPRCLDTRRFWRRSMALAISSWSLGRRIGIEPAEEALLGGLLQDMGMLVLDRLLPAFYTDFEVPGSLDPYKVDAFESDWLGSTNHALLGAWLLEQWGFPERYQMIVAGTSPGAHTTIKESDEALVSCVSLSTAIASIWLSSGHCSNSREVASRARETAGLGPADLAAVLNTVATELPEAERVFGVALIDNAQSGDTLDDAREHLLLRNLTPFTRNARSGPSPDATGIDADYLESLPEWEGVEEQAASEMRQAREHGWPVSVAMIHLELDPESTIRAVTLNHAAARIAKTVRPSDIVFRHTDDVFGVVLVGTEEQGARAAARRLSQALAAETSIGDAGLSVGMACEPQVTDEIRLDSMRERAVQALDTSSRVGGAYLAVGEGAA